MKLLILVTVVVSIVMISGCIDQSQGMFDNDFYRAMKNTSGGCESIVKSCQNTCEQLYKESASEKYSEAYDEMKMCIRSNCEYEAEVDYDDNCVSSMGISYVTGTGTYECDQVWQKHQACYDNCVESATMICRSVTCANELTACQNT